jgi:hypothetical protein
MNKIDISFVNIISSNLGFISSCEIGSLFKAKNLNKMLYKFEYVVNADIFSIGEGFFVYQGSFIDSNYIFSKYDLVFPCSVFLEQNIIYLNLEGRYRYSRNVIDPIGVAQSDFDVCQALSILRISLIDLNFSILIKFFKLVKFFFFLVSYECSFFVTFQDFCNIFSNNFTLCVINDVNVLICKFFFFIKFLI